MIRLLVILLMVPGLHLMAGEVPSSGGLGIAPALAFVENVVPGQPVHLGALGLPIIVSNHSDRALKAELVPSAFMPYSMASFECGFEYLPDNAWLTLTPRLMELKLGGQERGELVLNIPDRPEHWNRHWVVCVETGVPSRMALGATLSMQARILVETAAKDGDAAAGPKGELGIAPSRVAMQMGADGGWTGSAQVRSAAAAEAVFDVLDIMRVYPPATHADRHGRFFAHQVTAITANDWGRVEPATFTLAPGAVQQLICTATPPRRPGAEERIQEIRFIARRALPGAVAARCRLVDGRLYDRMELLRLIYTATGDVKTP